MYIWLYQAIQGIGFARALAAEPKVMLLALAKARFLEFRTAGRSKPLNPHSLAQPCNRPPSSYPYSMVFFSFGRQLLGQVMIP